MTRKSSVTQQKKAIVEQLKLDPTSLELIDCNIETGLDIIDLALNEADPSQFAETFDRTEALILAKLQFFRSREVC